MKLKHLIISVFISFILLNLTQIKAEESISETPELDNTKITDQYNLIAPLKLSIIKTDNYYVDLEDVLNIAVENNINLQIKEEQEKIDKLDIYTQASELLPSVIGTYDQSRFQGGFQIFGNETFMVHRSSIAPRLALEYTIFSGGETVYKILAAKRTHNATIYSITNEKDQLLLDASIAYYELVKANKFLQISIEEIKESKELLNLNLQRLEVGLGTKLEVSQSESQLAVSKNDYIEASKNILVTTQNLNKILNLPLEINLIPKTDKIEKITLLETPNIKDLIEKALENRSDLKEIKELKKVYLAQRGVALSKFFPTLTFSTYWGGMGPRFHDLNDQKSVGYGVKLDLLKNLGVNYISNYKKSGPMLKQVDLQIQQKLREIETNLSNAILEAETTEKQIEVAKAGLKASEDSYQFATERLEAGVGTNIDVLTAHTKLTTARINLVKSLIDYNKSQIALLRSSGDISINQITNKQDSKQNTEIIKPETNQETK
ncbi:MAG: TolC family protein [Vampirovibrionia bacterium]